MQLQLMLFTFAVAVFVAVSNTVAAPNADDVKTVAIDANIASRAVQFRRAMHLARGYMDQLEVDPVDLITHGVKGKKKLGEALETYETLLRLTDTDQIWTDEEERAEAASELRARIGGLIAHTRRSEYHNMRTCSDKEFAENSMSYFRVLTLMGSLGFDTSYYKEQLMAAKPRMDGHLRDRGPWQRDMFRTYYQKFDLDLPDFLTQPELSEDRVAPSQNMRVIDKQPPAMQLSQADAYRLTHEVYVAYEYGREMAPVDGYLTASNLEYLNVTIPAMVTRYIHEKDLDLLAEVLSCYTYLGPGDDLSSRLSRQYWRAVDHLLRRQNADGSWGDYEQHRPRFGQWLDHHVYLHTVLVSARALAEALGGIRS